MGLFDFLMNRKSSAAPVSKPSLPVLQMDANGGIDAEAVARVKDYINSPEAKAQAIKPTLAERLFGRDITTDTQTIDPETNAVTMETKSLHQPGYLEQAGAGLKRGINDLLGGYNENRTQNFSVNNWNNNYLDNGNKKGLVYRFGEGLGSFAKLAESPIGRSLLVGGIVGATGGDGLQALTYGAQTGVMNQQNRAKDQMYRNSLIESAKSSIMNSKLSDEEKERQIAEATNRINSYRGYIGDDTYKQILAGMQLRDNAEYRNALLKGQQKDNEINLQLALAKLEQEKVNNATKNALEQQKLNLEKLKIENEGKEVQNKGDMVFSQLQLLEDAFNNMPQSKAKVGQKGKAILTGATNLVGLRNDDVTAYEAIRNPLVTTLARSIAGEKGVLTDRDFARAEKMVPTSFDSPEQAQAKFEQIRKLVGVSLGGSTPQTGNTTKSGVKYEVID